MVCSCFFTAKLTCTWANKTWFVTAYQSNLQIAFCFSLKVCNGAECIKYWLNFFCVLVRTQSVSITLNSLGYSRTTVSHEQSSVFDLFALILQTCTGFPWLLINLSRDQQNRFSCDNITGGIRWNYLEILPKIVPTPHPGISRFTVLVFCGPSFLLIEL